MHRTAAAVLVAAVLPAAALAATITIDHTTMPAAVFDGIVDGFPMLAPKDGDGDFGGNPLSVVRKGDVSEVRSVMEFPLAALAGIAPDSIVAASLRFNIDDVLSTLGPGVELNGQGADTILVHFYPGDGQALLNDFGRTTEAPASLDTGSGVVTDGSLQQSGPVVFTVDARPRLLAALAAGTPFLGVLWRTNDSPTGTSLDDGRGGSASGEPSDTVPGSRMPYLTVEVAGAPATCGNGAVDAGEQCDDGNLADGDCCSGLCTHDGPAAPCSDGNACTEGDTCNGAGACVAGGVRHCDDANDCTSDACAPATGCIHTPANDGGACDDRNVCTTAETCMAGQCVGIGIDGTCDDGNPCTTGDACDASLCRGAPLDGAACDDGDACTASDTCARGACGGSPVCGNGMLEATCGEECDDGNAVGPDGCSAQCRHDAFLGGSGARECLARVALQPALTDGAGAIAAEQACTDGDPTCDADATPGACGFVVAGCFGLSDARLAACPAVPGVRARVLAPGAAGRASRRQLVAALRAVTMPGCMQPVTVRVPLRGRRDRLRPGKATLVFVARAAGAGRDRDAVRFLCRPGS